MGEKKVVPLKHFSIEQADNRIHKESDAEESQAKQVIRARFLKQSENSLQRRGHDSQAARNNRIALKLIKQQYKHLHFIIKKCVI